MLNLTLNDREMQAHLSRLSDRQVRIAGSWALNDTARDVLAHVQGRMDAVFDRPTPFTSLGVTAKITDNAWYVFASPSEVPCFEWGLLEGYTAPRFRMEDPFGRQGTMFSLEHDFGCGAIDFRGGYKNAGA